MNKQEKQEQWKAEKKEEIEALITAAVSSEQEKEIPEPLTVTWMDGSRKRTGKAIDALPSKRIRIHIPSKGKVADYYAEENVDLLELVPPAFK